jgi:glutaredoxin
MSARPRFHAAAWVAVLIAAGFGGFCVARPAAAAEPRCLVIDVFPRSAEGEAREAEERVVDAVAAFARERNGMVMVRRFIDTNPDDRAEFERLQAKYHFAADATPVITVCGRVMHGVRDPAVIPGRLREALEVEVFTRPGCARCTAAKDWLATLRTRYPAFETAVFDLAVDAEARSHLAALVKRHRTAAASVPVLHVCNRIVVGFDRGETTGTRIEALLEPWSRPCREPIGSADDHAGSAHTDSAPIGSAPTGSAPTGNAFDVPAEFFEEDGETGIDLPLFGRIDSRALGMPLFTIVIGLVDGFNPCAMWVLLLLLSILVNIRDRLRIILIAGTFVLVSGLAYFAFMAAWLHVFEWIGYLRPVQIALGLLAITIGAIHVKDFFAFKRGVSLSIPESAKPGIYERMRRIVTAENLPAALLTTFTLAVLVNIVELLCTAGLPALYTNILSRQGYSLAGRYGYLALYIAAYMFDDALMVAAVVWSFSKFKLQETGGRWLKLISGAVILVLGLVMLLRPEWLE